MIGFVDIANNVLDPVLQIPYDFYVYRMVKKHPNQIEMSNIKELIGEALYGLGAFLLMLIAFFIPEPSTFLFMIIFGVFAFFLLLMQLVSKIKVSKEVVQK